jgi:hypothetical protein
VISGSGAFMQKGIFSYLNGPNTYTGGTYPAAGAIGLGISSVGSGNSVSSGPIGTGPLLLMPDSTTTVLGDGQIFASGSAITLGNLIEYPSGTNNLTLVIGGSTNLTLSGPYLLNGNDGLKTFSFRTIEVTNTALTTITGLISDSGSNYGFNVTGDGVLALNNTEAYSGPTTISNATVLVNGQVGTNSVTVYTNGTLGGSGVVTGPVSIQNYGTLSAGNQSVPGTLTINNSLTFAAGSTNRVLVNQTGGTHDLVTGLTSVTYNGTLFATNLAGALAAGDNFQIFSIAGTGNFTTIAGSPGPGLGWSFNPANGQLSVVQTVATNPTNILFSVSGGNLNLSWPADHLGWSLQVQTNSLAQGLGANWVTVPNSSAVNSTNFAINPTNGTVFYRLKYP